MSIVKDSDHVVCGNFREHSRITNMGVFDPINYRPLVPLACHTCGKPLQRHDFSYIIEFGMCSECIIWWQDELKLNPEQTIEVNIQKFKDYLKRSKGITKYRCNNEEDQVNNT